ncbi:hypothetical protein [Chryseobacterium cheonjiense]|uniref:Uncharacterized protein n=1 Tax=Chryseobacterium cheonjiense TaxID=2728845 RepID=A0A7Y0FKN6_9FLAO|nr:hypothetical protein [Chryseobacterium cheonjiense]NML59397.1 hypothetical protein [Chryseobacterium cheonjiense]
MIEYYVKFNLFLILAKSNTLNLLYLSVRKYQMKKAISILALLSVFTLNFAQEKEGCCAGKDKKHCSAADKKANAEYHKGCEKKESTAQNRIKTNGSKEKKAKKTA